MNETIRHGQWLQFRGRTKRAVGRLFADDALIARGDADIVSGALEESFARAKRRAVDGVSQGVDKLASTTKRLVNSI